MRNILAAVLCGLGLAACGVDGAPTPPEPEPERQQVSGASISGSFGVGVKR